MYQVKREAVLTNIQTSNTVVEYFIVSTQNKNRRGR
jgi:hypothetical protein